MYYMPKCVIKITHLSVYYADAICLSIMQMQSNKVISNYVTLQHACTCVSFLIEFSVLNVTRIALFVLHF